MNAHSKKNTTTLVFTAVSLIASALAVDASPLVSYGEQLDVRFKGTSNLAWQSNLFSDADGETEDFLLTVSPGFDFNFGRGVSNADLSVETRVDVLRYDESHAWDTETFHINAFGDYSAARYDLKASLSFDETQSSLRDHDPAVKGKLSKSDRTKFSLSGEYELSPKFSFGAALDVSDRKYTGETAADYANSVVTAVPLDFFYELTPKLDLSVGYKYTNRDLDSTSGDNSAHESVTHFLSVGARGDLLPKLSGSIKFGFSRLDSDYQSQDDKDDSGLGVDANLNWTASPKLSHNLALARDFGSTSNGTRIEESSVNIRTQYTISDRWTSTASLGYTLREYMDESRDDAYATLGLRANYSPSEYWSFGGGYAFSDNDSDAAASNFNNHKIDISASLRY